MTTPWPEAVTAGQPRDIQGALRLGSEIRESISAELRRRGLGHQPRSIPDDHRELVRVYRLGSPVGELIRAAREVSRDHDKKLREAVRSPELIERIKTIIEDGI